ncbi:hypothetical protein FQN54_000715 [Arachnomyces sp. PD_36]|nr:hypothetical protein FQN54_000715 [Arachnomyces sp. PD_36]
MLFHPPNRYTPSPSSSSYYIFSLLLTISSATQPANAVKCYFTDGSEADETYEPCNPDQEFSACCATNKVNGGDPDICLTVPTDHGAHKIARAFVPDIVPHDGGIQVMSCPGGEWCCVTDSQESCCDDASSLNVGTLMVPSATTAPTTTFATTCPTVTSTVIGAPESPAKNDNTSECTGSDPTTIGAGVGASLGVCLLLALVALWWQGRSYRRKLRDVSVASMPLVGGPNLGKDVSNSTNTGSWVAPAEVPARYSPPIYEIGGTARRQQ